MEFPAVVAFTLAGCGVFVNSRAVGHAATVDVAGSAFPEIPSSARARVEIGRRSLRIGMELVCAVLSARTVDILRVGWLVVESSIAFTHSGI